MKVQLLELIEALFKRRKNLVLILLKQTQNFVWVIIVLIIVTCLQMENKSSGLKLTIEILTFQLNFVLEAYLTDLVLLSLNGNVYDF